MPFSLRKKKLHSVVVHDRHDLWAFFSILIFPLAMLAAGKWGTNPMQAFGIGMFATLIMLGLNALGEKELWMFSHAWKHHFEHPEFSFRLAMLAGVVLILVETTLLLYFFLDPDLDHTLLQLVFSRQCQTPNVAMQEFCGVLNQTLRF